MSFWTARVPCVLSATCTSSFRSAAFFSTCQRAKAGHNPQHVGLLQCCRPWAEAGSSTPSLLFARSLHAYKQHGA